MTLTTILTQSAVIRSSGVLCSFVADGGQVECFVVVSACGVHWAIVQSRCLIRTYHIQTGDDNASRLFALPFGSAIIYIIICIYITHYYSNDSLLQ